jgi:hypothetical protein
LANIDGGYFFSHAQATLATIVVALDAGCNRYPSLLFAR